MRFFTAAYCVGLFCLGLFPLVSIAEAHHSLSAYDSSMLLEITGTVSEYEWRNPHIRIRLRAPEQDNNQDAMIFDGPNTGFAARLGWRPDSFHTGERITVSYNPFLDGRPGGHLVEIRTAQGDVYSLLRFRGRGVPSPARSGAEQ
jgi:hypothetical protein